MFYYFDSSAAVKRYAPEKGSDWVKTVIARSAGNTVYLGQIGVVEIAAALSKKVRSKELANEEYEASFGLFLADVENYEYFTAPLHDEVIWRAVDLTKRHPLRGYDAVHLATAITLNTLQLEANLPSLTFVSGDKLLCDAAQKEGFTVYNPNEH